MKVGLPNASLPPLSSPGITAHMMERAQLLFPHTPHLLGHYLRIPSGTREICLGKVKMKIRLPKY